MENSLAPVPAENEAPTKDDCSNRKPYQIYLDRDLHAKVKAIAAIRRKSMSDIYDEIVRFWLGVGNGMDIGNRFDESPKETGTEG